MHSPTAINPHWSVPVPGLLSATHARSPSHCPHAPTQLFHNAVRKYERNIAARMAGRELRLQLNLEDFPLVIHAQK